MVRFGGPEIGLTMSSGLGNGLVQVKSRTGLWCAVDVGVMLVVRGDGG